MTLDLASREALRRYLRCLALARASVSSVTAPREAWDVHVADSLSGLELAELTREGLEQAFAARVAEEWEAWARTRDLPLEAVRGG